MVKQKSEQDYYREMLKARRSRKCMWSNAGQGDCDKEAIDSHSLQRLGPLAAIAKNNKVIGFVDKLENGLPIHLGIKPKLLGTKKEASVFGGYCSGHDSALFKKVEAKEVSLDAESFVALGYMAICRQLVGVEAVIEYGPYVGYKVEEYRETARQLRINKHFYERKMAGHDVGNFYFCVSRFFEELPFCSSACIVAKHCIDRTPLPKVSGYLHPFLTLFAGRLGSDTIFVVSGFADRFGNFARYMSGVKKSMEVAAGSLALNMSLAYSDNIYFSPDWFDGLTALQKEQIEQLLIGNWTINGRDVGIDHQLGWINTPEIDVRFG